MPNWQPKTGHLRMSAIGPKPLSTTKQTSEIYRLLELSLQSQLRSGAAFYMNRLARCGLGDRSSEAFASAVDDLAGYPNVFREIPN